MVTTYIPPCQSVWCQVRAHSTYPLLSWYSNLPDHHVQRSIVLLLRARVEALLVSLELLVRLTNGWSFRH